MRSARTAAAASRRAAHRAAFARAWRLPPVSTFRRVRRKGTSSDRAKASAPSSSASLSARRPWSTPCAKRPKASRSRKPARTCKSAVESGPPLTATRTVEPRGANECSRSAARTRVTRVGGWERGTRDRGGRREGPRARTGRRNVATTAERPRRRGACYGVGHEGFVRDLRGRPCRARDASCATSCDSMTTASDSTRIATVPWGRIARVLPAALALAPAAVLLVGAVDRRWMDDDGFINLRVVRNWLHGDGLVFNLDERVEAVTSPLWLAVLAALGALDARLELAAVAAGVLLTLVGLLLAQAGAARLCAQAGLAAGDRLRAAPVPVGAAIFAALPAAWDYASSGLETGLGLAWLGASFVAMARSVRATAASRVRVMASALLVGLGPL